MEKYSTGGYLCPTGKSFSKKAKNISKNLDEDYEISKSIYEWVRDNYCWGFPKIRGSRFLLEENVDVATSMDKTNLLVSLLRSIDIPCRYKMVKVVFYNEYKNRLDDSVHVPAEVYLDREWVIADPAFGKHTRKFKSVSKFGEKTWEELKKSKELKELPRHFVLGYNYLIRFTHPKIRKLKKELEEARTLG